MPIQRAYKTQLNPTQAQRRAFEAQSEAELANARALCRRLARDITTVGDVLAGRVGPEALVWASCN